MCQRNYQILLGWKYYFNIKPKGRIYDTHIYTTNVIICTMITCIQSILISHDQNMNTETHTNPENNHNAIMYYVAHFSPFFWLNTYMYHICIN